MQLLESITDIKNFLGHESLQSTMVYLKLSLTVRKEAQKKFVKYTESLLKHDAKMKVRRSSWTSKHSLERR